MCILKGMSFDEITEVYGAFPLKDNFMEAGNAALEKIGMNAELNGSEIRIHFLSRPYFDEEDLEELGYNGFEDEDIAEFSKWTLEGEAYIDLGKANAGLIETGTDYHGANCAYDDERFEDLYDRITDEDESLGAKAIEVFMDVAVDVG